jgi:hypothetical protein
MTIRRTGNRWQAVVDGRTVASPQYGQKPRRSPRPRFPFYSRLLFEMPRRGEDRPDRDRLALRFEQFKKSA